MAVVSLTPTMSVRNRQSIISLALGIVIVLLYLTHAAYYGQQINDDAFITFRYSKQLSLGHGPYFNPGEHVEGYTNPLMMVLMGLSLPLVGDDGLLRAAKLVGVLAGLFSLLACWALSKRLLETFESLEDWAPTLAWASPALLATHSPFAVNSTTGLETTLFALCITSSLWLVLKGRDEERWTGAGILLALAVLTRPEGVAIAAVIFCARLFLGEWRGPMRRSFQRDAAVVGAVFLLHLALRMWLYDGEILPNTYFAKMGGMASKVSAWDYLWSYQSVHLGGFLVLLAVVPLFGRSPLRRSILPSLAVLLFGFGSVFLTGPDGMLGYRLLVPYAPIWSVLVVVGLATLARALAPARAKSVAAILCIALIAGLAWHQSSTRQRYRSWIEIRRAGYVQGHFALAEWLAERSVPGDKVALMDIGIVGYRNPELRILEITGLTDRYIAKSPGEFLHKHFDNDYVFDQKPRFLVVAVGAPRQEDEAAELAALKPWTETELALMTDERFAPHYYRPSPIAPEASLEERLSASFGAEKAFEHLHPLRRYFLLVYEYKATTRSPPR